MHIITHILLSRAPAASGKCNSGISGSKLGRVEQLGRSALQQMRAGYWFALFAKFARTTWGFPYQLKHFAGVRDCLGMDTTGKHCAPPPRPTFSSKGWERKQGKKESGSGVVRRMWTRDVNRTAASKLLLDCAHLHVLMHHSSAPLRHGAKHYIYFANANLC